jgi:hypothetical protein
MYNYCNYSSSNIVSVHVNVKQVNHNCRDSCRKTVGQQMLLLATQVQSVPEANAVHAQDAIGEEKELIAVGVVPGARVWQAVKHDNSVKEG